MNITHIEHIGIAVKDLSQAIPYYENVLGLKCYNIEEVADQKVKTAFFKVGQTKIELLEPTCEESTIAKFIANKGEGIHHIAFNVDKVAESLNEVEEKGVRLIDKAPHANTVQIAKKVKEQLPDIKKNLPADVKLDILVDNSENITNTIASLEETILIILLLVVVVVLFFLGRWRATVIIAIVVPVSLIGAFIYLLLTGNTLSQSGLKR